MKPCPDDCAFNESVSENEITGKYFDTVAWIVLPFLVFMTLGAAIAELIASIIRIAS